MKNPLYPSGPVRAARHPGSPFPIGVGPRRWQPAAVAIVMTVTFGLPLASAIPAAAADDLPVYLRDRGRGVQTSLFGTYVEKGEFLFYPFYEPTFNSDQEYKPAELGYSLEQDFRAKRTDHEALVFLAYGFSDRLALEVESALYTTATQHKAADDPSSMPNELTESGLGDTQAELRWRMTDETERKPEFFSYFEAVFPLQKDKVLIGTSELELIVGVGLIKGGAWGTLSARASGVYETEAGSVDTDEFAVEYLKRTSAAWRWVASIEGNQDEWSAIGEAQWFLRPRTYLKLNSGFGLTDKAPDLAPEMGIMFSF